MAAPAQHAPQTQTDDNKALRGQLRNLLYRAKHDKHNLVSVENNKILELVQESNELVKQVTRPRDQAVDSEMFNTITQVGLEYMAKLKQKGQTYTAADFLRRLKTQFVNNAEAQHAGAEDPMAFDWAGLGQQQSVVVLFQSVPWVHHMLGPMDAQPRQKRQIQRQARRRAPLGEAVRPEEVADLEDQEKQETDRNMEEMWKVLREAGGRAGLLDLVMNPASFSQTVENLFTLSFLVRDNRAALEDNEEEGIVVVQRGHTKQHTKQEKDETDKMQFVIPMDIETWEALKQGMDPNQPPMMRHRMPHRHAAAQEEAEEEGPEEQQQQEAAEESQQRQQRRQQAAEVDEEEEEEEQQPQPKPAKKRQRRQQQEQQEQVPDVQQVRPRTKATAKQQAQAAPAALQQRQQPQATQQQQQHQQQEPQGKQASGSAVVITSTDTTKFHSVIDLADSSKVVDLVDSSGDEEETSPQKPPPMALKQVKQEDTPFSQQQQQQQQQQGGVPASQGTQQGTQLTGSQRRAPKRGARMMV